MLNVFKNKCVFLQLAKCIERCLSMQSATIFMNKFVFSKKKPEWLLYIRYRERERERKREGERERVTLVKEVFFSIFCSYTVRLQKPRQRIIVETCIYL